MRASDGRLANNLRMLAVVLYALAAAAAGCGECDLGQSRCQGDVVGRCMTTGDTLDRPHWVGFPCPIACREAGGAADCVESPDPLPACAEAGPAEHVCFNGGVARCWGDFPTKSEACPSGTHCVMSPRCGGVCALEDQPDLRCSGGSPGGGTEHFCDGAGVAHRCACEFVWIRTDCGGPDLCHVFEGTPWCTVSPAPDPRCGEPAPLTTGFCTDNVLSTCWYGYVVEVRDCGAAICTVGSSPPSCWNAS